METVVEGAAAVAVGFVVVFYWGDVEVLDVLGFGVGGGQGDEEHVAEGDYGADLLFFGGAGDGELGVGEWVAADAAEVEVDDFVGVGGGEFGEVGGVLEFDVMALVVVDADGVDFGGLVVADPP